MSRRLVLIVEDSRDLAANLEIACLAIPNVEVKVATGAAEAWTLLEDVRPGDSLVMVTDMRLPDADGIDLIGDLRRHASLASTPIVAVSGDSDPALPRRLAQLGVSAFYRKPYSPISVANHLRTLLDALPNPA
ncbi:MAG: response regulator [Bryobacterales bacterium]|nr:response regulator [Bryobacterales bacterium]